MAKRCVMTASRSFFPLTGFFILLLAAVALFLFLVSPTPTPSIWMPPNEHAVEKHGADAGAALQWIQGLSREKKEFCKYECPDGRTRYACGMKGGNWAVVVYEGVRLITSFITDDQAYIKGSITDPCSNGWNYSHP